MISNEDLQRRVDHLEVTYRELVDEIRESNRTMNKLALDIHSLAVNVSHLTPFIERTIELKDKCHVLEKDTEILKMKVDNYESLKGEVRELSNQVAKQSPITDTVRVVGTSLITSGLGILLFTMLSK